MKFKKVINKFLLVLVMSISVFLTGCFSGGNPIGGGSGSGGGTPPTIPETPGDSLNVHEMFNKFKILYNNETLTVKDPVTNEQVAFTTLLDRQITILSQDLLYRLTAVYGEGMSDATTEQYGKSFYLKYGAPIADYAYGLDKAFVNSHYLLERATSYVGLLPRFLNSEGNFDTRVSPKITEASSYADIIFSGGWIDGFSSPLTKNFNFENSIIGTLTWVDNEDENLGYFDNTYTTNLQWSWLEYDGNASNYFTSYLDEFKLEIAKILSPEHLITTGLTYNQIVSKIEYLGFNTNDYNQIVEMILNKVIGTENAELDNQIFELILEPVLQANNYVLPNAGASEFGTITTSLDAASVNSGINADWLVFYDLENNLIDNTKDLWHYFKAYDVLVPALVERALVNSFGVGEVDRVVYEGGVPVIENGKIVKTPIGNLESVTVQDATTYRSLYPKMTKTGQFDILIEENTDDIYMYGPYDIKSVVLQPIAEDGVGVLSLIVAISPYGTLQYKDPITVKFSANVKYVANGVVYLNEIVLTETVQGPTYVFDGIEMPHNFELSIYDRIKTTSDGKYLSVDEAVTSDKYPILLPYNGTDISQDQYDLWNNNPYRLSGYNFGDNYIEITFNLIEVTKNGVPYAGNVEFEIGFFDPL